MVYLSLNYNPEKIIFLSLLLTFLASASSAPAIVIVASKIDEISAIDVSLVGVFGSLMVLANYILIIFPSIIFYIIPFAAGLTFYLPTAIIYGTLIKISNKDGVSFGLLLTYGVISEILYPDIFWFPYFLGWAGMLETTHFLVGKNERNVDYIILGFSYGAIGASLAVCYMMIGWGFYRPLFMTLPSAIADGILASLGSLIGSKIGRLAKNISI